MRGAGATAPPVGVDDEAELLVVAVPASEPFAFLLGPV